MRSRLECLRFPSFFPVRASGPFFTKRRTFLPNLPNSSPGKKKNFFHDSRRTVVFFRELMPCLWRESLCGSNSLRGRHFPPDRVMMLILSAHRSFPSRTASWRTRNWTLYDDRNRHTSPSFSLSDTLLPPPFRVSGHSIALLRANTGNVRAKFANLAVAGSLSCIALFRVVSYETRFSRARRRWAAISFFSIVSNASPQRPRFDRSENAAFFFPPRLLHQGMISIADASRVFSTFEHGAHSPAFLSFLMKKSFPPSVSRRIPPFTE